MVWQTVFLIVGILFVGGCNGVSPDLTFEVFEDSLNSMAQAYLPRLKYNALIPGYTTTTVKKLLPGAYEKCPDCNIKCFVTFVPFVNCLYHMCNHCFEVLFALAFTRIRM